jgi:alkane 1-monooxygenase
VGFVDKVPFLLDDSVYHRLYNNCSIKIEESMSPIAYLIPIIFPVLGLTGIWLGGAWTVALPLVVFGLLPLIELFLKGRGAERDDASGVHTVGHDAVLLVSFGTVWVVWGLMMYQFSFAEMGVWEILGTICCAGVVFGGLGINVAHELGHRSNKTMQILARLLLLPSLYTHFFIEHNRGHHRHMGTPDDPATAREGESVYAFWIRSAVGGWLSAWRIESHRLRGKGVRAHLMGNMMLHLQTLQVLCLVCVGLVSGPAVASCWIAAAIVGFLMLETVNYIEHYGLVRHKLPDGKYERISNQHSWTSDHPISRALLFELPRHADHHAHAGRQYGSLRHFSQAPQLPTGYAGMIILALVPPLFLPLMRRHMQQESMRTVA